MKAMVKKFIVTFTSLLVLCVIGCLVLLDSADMSYSVAGNQLTDLPKSVIAEKKRRSEAEQVCLLITDSTQGYAANNASHMQDVLELMRIGYQTCDISQEALPAPENYRTIVVSMYDLEHLAEYTDILNDWVFAGGRLLFQTTMSNSPAFLKIAPNLGITDSDLDYRYIQGFTLADSFMIGSENGFTYHWESEEGNEDSALQIMNVKLDQSAQVYAWSDDQEKTPMIWSRDYGDGRFVMMNHDYFTKTSRGMTCAAYSLLEDHCIYPVINASCFFIDDFPSPVPFGTSEYIQRDYNTTIADFYSNIWWPDMLKLGNTYGIKYTGLLIEDYTDNVTGEFPRQTSTERFNHFGASLLNHGGEIGLHGYNHQPLAFTGFAFDEGIHYNTWLESADMKRAFDEMIAFAAHLYPEITPTIYVPPSNILSPEGRQFLRDNYPQVGLISGLYTEDPFVYVQEFEIAQDGIIEFPRLTSGSVLDEFNYFSQLNAMNMYYTASHFIHPDDALDIHRGAQLGWEQLYENTNTFLRWIYTSAKGIRSMTASDGGRAIARYDTLCVERTETLDAISLRLGGFWDEAYLLMRFNDGTPGEIIGGTAEHISGDFYLLRATASQVTIKKA